MDKNRSKSNAFSMLQISKVWTAITDKDEMKHWYFDIPKFKPEVGCKFEFGGGQEDANHQYLASLRSNGSHCRNKDLRIVGDTMATREIRLSHLI